MSRSTVEAKALPSKTRRVYSQSGGRIHWLLCLLLSAVLGGAVPAQDSADSRVDVPSPDRQKAIRAQLDQTFGLSTATNALKKAQALRELMKIADDPATSGDELYVVLQAALPLIREKSDLAALRTTVEKLTETFRVDPINEQAKQLEEFIAVCKSSFTLDQAVKDVVVLVELANGENRFADAKRSLEYAESAAKKLNARNSLSLLAGARKLVEERDKAFADQRKASQTLMTSPDDPQANFQVGLTKGVFEGQWDEALPFLAKGSDAKWQAAAKAELAVTKELDSRLKVADAWWEVAQSATGTAQSEVQLRTHELYESLEPDLTSPVSKIRVTDRRTSLAKILKIKPAEPEPAHAGKPGDGGKIAEKNELPVGKPIDLLEMVKLPDHAVLGNWTRLDGAIGSQPMKNARFMVPIVVTGNYQVTCKFTRRTGKDAVFVLLPVGDTQCSFMVDGWGGTICGVGLVGKRSFDRLVGTPAAIRRAEPMANGVSHTLDITVTTTGQSAGIQGSLDGKRLIAWKGTVSQLSLLSDQSIPNPHGFGVLVWNSVCDIHELTLELKRGGRGFHLGDDWKNPLFVVADQPTPEIAKRCITWNGKKYFMSDKPLSLPDAQVLATQLNGRLLTISSSDEEKFFFEQGRGLTYWMAGYHPSGLGWRDERNRALRYIGKWAPRQPQNGATETRLMISTAASGSGWHDAPPEFGGVHACIEWGAEYSE